MSGSYASQTDLRKSIHDFLVAGASNELTDESWADFERLLRENDEACRLYAGCVGISVLLPSILSSMPNEDGASSDGLFPMQPGQAIPSPLDLSGTAWHGIGGYFASGWPVAYLIATLIFAIGLAIGAFVHVSQPTPIALPTHSGGHHEVVEAGGEGGRSSLSAAIVARITGMVDCVWETKGLGIRDWRLGERVRGEGGTESDSPLSPLPSPLVHLGDRLALRSGLLEITYDTGARVILQGPVTYEVESSAGGYLSLGRLTARLEKGSGIFPNPKRQRGAGGKDDSNGSANPLTSDLCPLTSDSFAVRTPTALVTDLGTEFGVEVDQKGSTKSHVFRGVVRLQPLRSDGQAAGEARVLHENESARVDGQGSDRGNPRVVMADAATPPTNFVREIPKPSIKTFDLADVVAGGNGFSALRNRGIDPTSGRTVDAPPKTKTLMGDGRYHRVEGLPFVDGVFIPDNRRVPSQIDSAGHTFDAFGNAFNETSHNVWAGGPIPPDGSGRVIPTVLGGVDYASSGHGLLFMQANKGITFDLDAIRRANPSYRLMRFRTVVGNTETPAAMNAYLRTGATTFFAADFQVDTAGTMPTTATLKPGAATVGNWLVADSTGTSAQVVNNVDPTSNQAGSNHYLKIVRSGPDDRVLAAGWNGGETEGQIVQMSASVWVSSGSNAMAYLDGHANLAFDGRSFTVYLGADGAVKFYDGTAFVTTGLVSHPDTWQHVVVTANMAARRFSIKLDDQPLYTGGVWLSGATRVAYLLVGREGSRGTVYFDNVRLGECIDPPQELLAEKGEPNRGSADVWILVDGERRAGRRGNTGAAGAFPLTIPIGQNDRFLTLAATDGGDGLFWDWILFGDPRIELVPIGDGHQPNAKTK